MTTLHNPTSVPLRKLGIDLMTRVGYCAVTAAIVVAMSCLDGGAAAAAGCRPSSCGDIQNISYPFRLRGDPKDCGDSPYELTCERNRTLLLMRNSVKYLVRAIRYEDQLIQLVTNTPFLSGSLPLVDERFDWCRYAPIVFVNCSRPVEEDPFYADATCCIDAAPSPHSSSSKAYFYAFSGHLRCPYAYNYCYYYGVPWHLPRACRVVGKVLIGNPYGKSSERRPLPSNCSEVHDLLLQGFTMSWRRPLLFGGRERRSRLKDIYTVWVYVVGYYAIAGRATIGYLCVLAYLVYKFRRRHLAMDDMTESFLSEYRNCMPTRYSYRQIRKMAHRFKDKLGQGGFGSVFKGNLLTGRPVAIKMLDRSKENGQDFINEVATIGRIHHTNVVQLLGFCAEGPRKALVYEFMPNGSLDKYIFPQEGKNNSLSWEKMLNIAVGVARGMEYLHRGCNMQILHFDIKPHNVLLDENLNPKISDFGLAKLYPIDDSKVSITAVRGTIGYIAPELFYRKVGSVSNKSDVYSFGMLLMELTGKRRNVSIDVQNSSQMYFPSWIYDQLEQGGDMGMADATQDEKDIAKKMVIVALSCIQMKPTDRPTMSKVLEMLESDLQQLQMPAKPFLSSPNYVIGEDITVWDELSCTSLETFQCVSEQVTQEDQAETPPV